MVCRILGVPTMWWTSARQLPVMDTVMTDGRIKRRGLDGSRWNSQVTALTITSVIMKLADPCMNPEINLVPGPKPSFM